MSAVDLPEELNLMMMKKLGFRDLLRLYNARSEFAELRYLKSLEKTIGNESITLDQLSQLYLETTTKNQANLCLHPQILDKLEINSFNELIHLYMKPEYKCLFSDNKLIASLRGQIIIVKETGMDNESEFWSCCAELLAKVEGEILLILMHGVSAIQVCPGIEGKDFRSRVRYFIMSDLDNDLKSVRPINAEMDMMSTFPNLAFKYHDKWEHINSARQWVFEMNTSTLNGADTAKKLISIMKSNVLKGVREHLERNMPFIESRLIIHQHEETVDCSDCRTWSRLRAGRLRIVGRVKLVSPGPICVLCGVKAEYFLRRGKICFAKRSPNVS